MKRFISLLAVFLLATAMSAINLPVGTPLDYIKEVIGFHKTGFSGTVSMRWGTKLRTKANWSEQPLRRAARATSRTVMCAMVQRFRAESSPRVGRSCMAMVSRREKARSTSMGGRPPCGEGGGQSGWKVGR